MFLIVPCLSLFVIHVLSNSMSGMLHESEITGFNWSQILPSPHLKWYPCYQSYECARLKVPLDWSNDSNLNTASIALTKVPSVVSHDHPTFAGAVLINPGGPGGSGTDEVIWVGYGIRDNIIDSSDKHFEIIGFDPRGVHHTTPGVSCFANAWERNIWQYRNWAVGQLDSSANALNVKWALYESLAKLCTQAEHSNFGDGTNMHQYVSTALTARDMVAIIDALQEEKVSKSLLPPTDTACRQTTLKSTKPALLNYWGWSYGTYLGNTFASMFPNRVGSMILDGNVDPYDYTRTGWLSNLFDNDKNLHWFYYGCFQARERCAFFDSNTTSLFDLQDKMNRLLQELAENPLPVVHDGAADLVTYYDMTNLIHGASYAPLYFWQDVAQVAADLLNKNGTSIVKYLKSLQIPQGPDSSIPNPPDKNATSNALGLQNKTLPYPPDYPGGLEGAISILCGDGDPIITLTKHDWQDRLSQLKNQSAVAGPFWAAIPFACQHWYNSLRPANHNRFTGPFESKLSDYDDRGHPLLFIGNTADPVTPVRNAIENSKHHEGSRVLIQDSPGHCAGPVNPSKCTFEVIRRFFANGTLPEEDTVCMGDRSAWDDM